jgi:hypothetical protein
MTALITQSNYIPWKGYFDNIAKADVFVVYDDAQYTRRDWRNRNFIKTSIGLQWLTIPVEVKRKYDQKISETLIADKNWQKKHLQVLKHNYAKTTCFKEMIDWAEEIYMTATNPSLSATNVHFLKNICQFLGIKTTFVDSSIFEIKGGRTEKLVNICTTLGATEYITGPLAKNYMDESLFFDKGINIAYTDYGWYQEYPQLFPPFQHHVSIFDLIFNCGATAKKYMKFTGIFHPNF